LDSFLEAYQSADALWYAEVPSYDYQVSNVVLLFVPAIQPPLDIPIICPFSKSSVTNFPLPLKFLFINKCFFALEV